MVFKLFDNPKLRAEHYTWRKHQLEITQVRAALQREQI